MTLALITGVSSTELSADEIAFCKDARPCGLILFKRNLESHDQIRALVRAFQDAVQSDELLVAIDEEGGRVQRLRPPLGRKLPPAAAYARLYESDPAKALDVARGAARLVADDLKTLGFNTNCAPVLDVPVPGADGIIGDRAYGDTPDQVAALGRAVAQGFSTGGVLPIMKHIPGHGRADKDSHLALPAVNTLFPELRETDFAAFRTLSDLPAAMSAHVVFKDIDGFEPASTSKRVIWGVIRTEIGFDGLLMSDDISMRALSGGMKGRAEKVIAAGCDIVLHCNGKLGEMLDAAKGSPELAGEALRRFEKAFSVTQNCDEFDRQAAKAGLACVLEAPAGVAESV